MAEYIQHYVDVTTTFEVKGDNTNLCWIDIIFTDPGMRDENLLGEIPFNFSVRPNSRDGLTDDHDFEYYYTFSREPWFKTVDYVYEMNGRITSECHYTDQIPGDRYVSRRHVIYYELPIEVEFGS